MIVIGLTGNIGSGKTYIANIFEKMNIPVFFADTEAKTLYKLHDVINEIRFSFGAEFVTENKVELKKLAKVVFSSKVELKKLEQIIHPRMKSKMDIWLKLNESAKLVILESAILFESGFDKFTNVNIVVTAPKYLRIKRVEQRDKLSKTEIINRMKMQMSETQKKKLSEFRINNNEKKPLLLQISKILDECNQLIIKQKQQYNQ